MSPGASTKDIDFVDTQAYLQHFRRQGCDADIIDNTEGVFNLCWHMVGEIDQLKIELAHKTVNIARLKEIVFGPSATPEEANNDDPAEVAKIPAADGEVSAVEPSPPPAKKPPKGHGRRSIEDYPGAEVVVCQHDALKPGEPCPVCQQGQMVLRPPKLRLQFDGAPPLQATRFELVQLGCSRCEFTTVASPPLGVDLSEKYTAKAKATLAYLHYGMGLPYYRLAKMQAMFGAPIAVSTQSELIASMMGPIHGVFNHLVVYAAQSHLIYQDDTGVKIQALLKENKIGNPARKGMYTSGFIAEGEHQVVLYFSGRAHAGENFEAIIEHRADDQYPVMRMADALAANSKHEAPAREAKCNSHAFRRFKSLLSTYSEAAQFVMHRYGQVYDHEAYCKAQQLNDEARLAHHQQHSKPVMDELKAWAEEMLTGGAEPNSPLAAECRYFTNHWVGLTRFLEVPGAPLDNNALEAVLKFMITYRKNSQTFKTVYSAEYGSRLISVIVTCMVNNIDAIDYMTELQRHEAAVWRDPPAWMPWCYQHTLQQLAAAKHGDLLAA